MKGGKEAWLARKATKMKTFTRPRQERRATYDLAKPFWQPTRRPPPLSLYSPLPRSVRLLLVMLFWRLQIVSHESFESNEFNSIELSSKKGV